MPYPFDEAPSQRFRFEQYYQILESNDITCKVLSFYSVSLWAKIYKPGNLLAKVFGVFFAILKRWVHVFKCLSSDYVFIHREVCPLGPPVFEWVLAKVFRKKIIYDYDDAIWLTDEKARFSNVIRCFWKVGYICSWSYKVSCGNQYLANYARQWNENVVLNPTTIDTNYHKGGSSEVNDIKSSKLKIGWTGSHSTLKYLNNLIPILKKLEKSIELIVICNSNPAYNLENYKFISWNQENEVSALLDIDIGVMPLPDDEWAKGKCGFKALQYMALGKPSIISPVGVNSQIVSHGQNGFLASSDSEWEKSLSEFLLDKELANKMGAKCRSFIEKEYSVNSNQVNFLSLFE